MNNHINPVNAVEITGRFRPREGEVIVDKMALYDVSPQYRVKRGDRSLYFRDLEHLEPIDENAKKMYAEWEARCVRR